MKNTNVREVGDSGDRFQEPKTLNGPFIEEPIQEQATQIIQSQTNRMSVDSTSSSDPRGLSFCDRFIGKGQSQTCRRAEWISLVDSRSLEDFLNNCPSLANEISSR
jgi:hypothetical protein